MLSMGILKAQLAMGLLSGVCVLFGAISMYRQKRARKRATLLIKRNQTKK